MVPVGFSGVAFDLPWKIGSRRNHNGKVANSPASSYLAYYRSHIRPSVLKVLVHYLSSTRSRCSTIHFAVPLGGDRAFFHCPAINRTNAGGSLLGSVPMSLLVPIVMVSGRSVLSHSIKAGDLRLFSNDSSLFVWNRHRLSQLCHLLRFRPAGILQASLQLDQM